MYNIIIANMLRCFTYGHVDNIVIEWKQLRVSSSACCCSGGVRVGSFSNYSFRYKSILDQSRDNLFDPYSISSMLETYFVFHFLLETTLSHILPTAYSF